MIDRLVSKVRNYTRSPIASIRADTECVRRERVTARGIID